MSRNHTIQRSDGLCLTANRTMGPLQRAPAKHIEMRPAPRFLDKSAQEQRRDDRTGKAVIADVVDVGNAGGIAAVVGRPERHAPKRVRALIGRA